MNQQAMYEELRSLGAATVYEAQGAKGALDSGIKPIDPASRLIGPALTVDTRPADNLMLHYALLKARLGDVLVVDAKGFLEAGPWGDVLTVAAMKIGVAGLVINGAVRDADAIVEMGFPVFCRGLSIKGTGKVQPGKVNLPVCIGDVVIRPGDIIVGDRDGLVVVSPDEVASVLESAGPGSQGERVPIGHREGHQHSGTAGTLADAGAPGTALTGLAGQRDPTQRRPILGHADRTKGT